MYLNELFKRKRIEKGLTQEALAKKLRIEQSKISRWEKNEIDIKKEYIVELADILEISYYEINKAMMNDIYLSPNICKTLNKKNLYLINYNTGIVEKDIKNILKKFKI